MYIYENRENANNVPILACQTEGCMSCIYGSESFCWYVLNAWEGVLAEFQGLLCAYHIPIYTQH